MREGWTRERGKKMESKRIKGGTAQWKRWENENGQEEACHEVHQRGGAAIG